MPTESDKDKLLETFRNNDCEDIVLDAFCEDKKVLRILDAVFQKGENLAANVGDSFRQLFNPKKDVEFSPSLKQDYTKIRYNARQAVKKPELPEIEHKSKFFDDVSIRMDDLTTAEVRKKLHNNSKVGIFADPLKLTTGVSYEKPYSGDASLKLSGEYVGNDDVAKVKATYNYGHSSIGGEAYIAGETSGVALRYKNQIDSRNHINANVSLFKDNDTAFSVNYRRDMRSNNKLFAGFYGSVPKKEYGFLLRIVFN